MPDLRDEMLNRFCAGAESAATLPPTLIVAAHPDDEVLGVGSRLPRIELATVVHTTDGAPRDMRDARTHNFPTREAYADARRKELMLAMGTAGLSNFRVWELGVIDQEAAHHMVEMVRNLAVIIWDTRPQIVVTHAYEGGHPDHDATAFAVHTALRLMRGTGVNLPVLIEMTSYHNGPNGIVTGEFLYSETYPARTVSLSPEEKFAKDAMLACFRTQQDTIKYFGLDFERFRIAPEYDFTRPPHPGKLFYENFSWGMTGQRFCELAAQALRELSADGSGQVRRPAAETAA